MLSVIEPGRDDDTPPPEVDLPEIGRGLAAVEMEIRAEG